MRIVRSSHFAIASSMLLFSGMLAAQLAPSHQPTQPAEPASPHGQMSVTQSGNPHGTSKSTLKAFAAECGVTDMSESKVQIFVAKADGKWRSLPTTAEGESTDINAARAWKDETGSIRVVDISRTNAAGDELQM